MAVWIDNRQKSIRISPEAVRETAQAVLNALDCPDGELSVAVVDDREIAELNRQYLHRQGPTNVIAFPMREGEFTEVTPQLLGDVVISADTAAKEGRAAGISFQERFDQLLVHGILHLFGYDHVDDDRKARAMAAKSDALMAMIRNMQEGGPCPS